MTDVTNYRGSVPVDATRTRERLLAEGARHFAERGIHGAQMREVVRAAGQANDSAVHYHFGSRDGLLAAICARHLDAMEPDRRERLARQGPDPDLHTVLTDLIAPTARNWRRRKAATSCASPLSWRARPACGAGLPRHSSATRCASSSSSCARCVRASMSPELAGERIADRRRRAHSRFGRACCSDRRRAPPSTSTTSSSLPTWSRCLRPHSSLDRIFRSFLGCAGKGR